MPRDLFPQPVGPRVGRRALRQQDGGAERESADDLPRAHDPAEVGRPVQELAGMQVGLVGDLLGDLHEEPAVDVDRSFRASGRAARVGDEQRVLGIERRRVEGRSVEIDDLRPCVVPAREKLAVGRQALPDEHVLDHRRHLDRSVRDRLHRHRRAFAERAVRRDQDPAPRVRQPRGEGVGPEAAEDGNEDRAHLRARHHRRDRLDRHRQVDRDPCRRCPRRARPALGRRRPSVRGGPRTLPSGRRRPLLPTRPQGTSACAPPSGRRTGGRRSCARR